NLSRAANRSGGAALHLCPRQLCGPEPAQHLRLHRQAPRSIPRVPRHSRARDLSPRLSVAASQSGEETRRVGRYESAANTNGAADSEQMSSGPRIDRMFQAIPVAADASATGPVSDIK